MPATLKTLARLTCLTGAVLGLSACAPLLTVVGYSQPAIQLATQLDRIKFIGDGVSYAGSGKMLTDHALSAVAGADCRLFNVASRKPVCAPPDADAAAVVAPTPARTEAEAPPQPAATEPATHDVTAAQDFQAEGE